MNKKALLLALFLIFPHIEKSFFSMSDLFVNFYQKIQSFPQIPSSLSLFMHGCSLSCIAALFHYSRRLQSQLKKKEKQNHLIFITDSYAISELKENITELQLYHSQMHNELPPLQPQVKYYCPHKKKIYALMRKYRMASPILNRHRYILNQTSTYAQRVLGVIREHETRINELETRLNHNKK
ncbi:MAG: hypothetical protein WA432_04165 [Candidatus Babeliaceae bacterium]